MWSAKIILGYKNYIWRYKIFYLSLYLIMQEEKLIPEGAHSFEVFAIKNSEHSPTGKEAFIGFKLSNGDFSFVGVPFTEPKKYTDATSLSKAYEMSPDIIRAFIVQMNSTNSFF